MQLNLKRVPEVFMKTTPWIVVDGYCACRCLGGSDPHLIENRIAFIEKTPRVRVNSYLLPFLEDWKNWKQGPKGDGGGDPEKDLTYGFDPDSREWCDAELLKLGYILDNSDPNFCIID
jgi:hypothetical protein